MNLLLIIIAASVSWTAFGVLLAAFSQTRQQAQGPGTFLILSTSAIGGAWFPTGFMPSSLQPFSKLTFVCWSVDGFLQALWREAGITAIVPHLAILREIGGAFNVISIRQF